MSDDAFDGVMNQFTSVTSVFADQTSMYRRKHSFEQTQAWAQKQLHDLLENVERSGDVFILTDRSIALHALAWELVLLCLSAGWLDD